MHFVTHVQPGQTGISWILRSDAGSSHYYRFDFKFPAWENSTLAAGIVANKFVQGDKRPLSELVSNINYREPFIVGQTYVRAEITAFKNRFKVSFVYVVPDSLKATDQNGPDSRDAEFEDDPFNYIAWGSPGFCSFPGADGSTLISDFSLTPIRDAGNGSGGELPREW